MLCLFSLLFSVNLNYFWRKHYFNMRIMEIFSSSLHVFFYLAFQGGKRGFSSDIKRMVRTDRFYSILSTGKIKQFRIIVTLGYVEIVWNTVQIILQI